MRMFLTLWLPALALAATAATAAAVVPVSQQRRAFSPREVTIERGQSLRFDNDDGELLHHVYTRSDAFSFDLGEQPPGSATAVPFPVPGAFTVLCAIHPRMRLQVTVR